MGMLDYITMGSYKHMMQRALDRGFEGLDTEHLPFCKGLMMMMMTGNFISVGE